MKKIFYLLLSILVLGCQKEKELVPTIIYDNAYVIEDDPNNPVTHRRFELYEKYGVPIFFSDTVKQIFLSKNIKGESVYGYETLDLNWKFSSTSAFDFKYKYITKAEEQLQALENVAMYIESSPKALRPFSILLVDNFTANGNSEILSIKDKSPWGDPVNTVQCFDGYRTMVMSQSHLEYNTGFWAKLSIDLLKTQLKTAIKGEQYKPKLSLFEKVSLAAWYDKYWNLSNKNLGVEKTFNGSRYKSFNMSSVYNPADEALYTYIREVFGRFGFIGHSVSYGWSSSPKVADDLNQYIDAIVDYNPEIFLRHWEKSPLVMEKYEILYDIIENDMNVPLKDIIK